MQKGKFWSGQIIRILIDTETGTTIPDVCCALGISKATFYRLQSLYGGMEIFELGRIKEFEEENRHLKQMYA